MRRGVKDTYPSLTFGKEKLNYKNHFYGDKLNAYWPMSDYALFV